MVAVDADCTGIKISVKDGEEIVEAEGNLYTEDSSGSAVPLCKVLLLRVNSEKERQERYRIRKPFEKAHAIPLSTCVLWTHSDLYAETSYDEGLSLIRNLRLLGFQLDRLADVTLPLYLETPGWRGLFARMNMLRACLDAGAIIRAIEKAENLMDDDPLFMPGAIGFSGMAMAVGDSIAPPFFITTHGSYETEEETSAHQ